jgi:hypothetical protein
MKCLKISQVEIFPHVNSPLENVYSRFLNVHHPCSKIQGKFCKYLGYFLSFDATYE